MRGAHQQPCARPVKAVLRLWLTDTTSHGGSAVHPGVLSQQHAAVRLQHAHFRRRLIHDPRLSLAHCDEEVNVSLHPTSPAHQQPPRAISNVRPHWTRIIWCRCAGGTQARDKAQLRVPGQGWHLRRVHLNMRRQPCSGWNLPRDIFHISLSQAILHHLSPSIRHPRLHLLSFIFILFILFGYLSLYSWISLPSRSHVVLEETSASSAAGDTNREGSTQNHHCHTFDLILHNQNSYRAPCSA